jgi:hypothetical protein
MRQGRAAEALQDLERYTNVTELPYPSGKQQPISTAHVAFTVSKIANLNVCNVKCLDLARVPHADACPLALMMLTCV